MHFLHAADCERCKQFAYKTVVREKTKRKGYSAFVPVLVYKKQ